MGQAFNNNNNQICKAPECQKTSVALFLHTDNWYRKSVLMKASDVKLKCIFRINLMKLFIGLVLMVEGIIVNSFQQKFAKNQLQTCLSL